MRGGINRAEHAARHLHTDTVGSMAGQGASHLGLLEVPELQGTPCGASNYRLLVRIEADALDCTGMAGERL